MRATGETIEVLTEAELLSPESRLAQHLARAPFGPQPYLRRVADEIRVLGLARIVLHR